MAEPLFIPQAKLEASIDKGEATFDDNVLTLVAQKASYRLAPAARVKSLIDGKDAHGLLGRVILIDDLAPLGAEHFPGTIIIGETGYECEEGFVGIEHGHVVPAPAASAKTPALPPGPVAPPPEAAAIEAQSAAEKADTDLLADFMLKNMG